MENQTDPEWTYKTHDAFMRLLSELEDATKDMRRARGRRGTNLALEHAEWCVRALREEIGAKEI